MKKPITLVPILAMMLISVSCYDLEMNSFDKANDKTNISEPENSTESFKNSPNYSYSQLQRLTIKMRHFHNFNVAIMQGYNQDLTGYVPGMGHHYANEGYLDGTFELEKPEALLYAPDENGVMQFLGVEYLVFMDQLEDPSVPPAGFVGDEDQWAIVGPFWTLHAWVGLENPNGVFAPFNPLVD